MPPKIDGLDHLVLTVRDIEATRDFYCRGLGMTFAEFTGADGMSRHALAFGSQKINLHLAGNEIAPHAKRPIPGSADICLLSDTPLSDWLEHLDTLGIQALSGIVERSGAVGPILSVYLRDPDGNLVEISNPA